MTKIFLSYRRLDSQAITDRIYETLVETFGKENVFQDVSGIPAGVNFKTYLERAVGDCDVLLVVIGQQWLNIQDDDGNQRLANPSDFVRIEIEAGLKRDDVLVIPLMVDNARMPAENTLPESLRPLHFLQSAKIRYNPDFTGDMQGLIQRIRAYMKESTAQRRMIAGATQPRKRRAGLVVAGLAILAALIAFAIINPLEDNGNNNNRNDPEETSTQAVAVEPTPNASPTSSPTPSHEALTATPSSTSTIAATNTATLSPTPTASPSPTSTATYTPSTIFIVSSATSLTQSDVIFPTNTLTVTATWTAPIPVQATNEPIISTPQSTATSLVECTAIVNEPTLNVRSGPSTANSIVGQVRQGDILLILTRDFSTSYIAINFRGSLAYVATEFVTIDCGTTPTLESTPTTAATCSVTTTIDANIRSGPSISYPLIGTAIKDTVLMTTTDDFDPAAYIPVIYLGQVGYVSPNVVIVNCSGG